MDDIEHIFRRVIEDFSIYVLIAGVVFGGLMGFCVPSESEFHHRRRPFILSLLILLFALCLGTFLVVMIFRFGGLYPLSGLEIDLMLLCCIPSYLIAKKLRYLFWG